MIKAIRNIFLLCILTLGFIFTPQKVNALNYYSISEKSYVETQEIVIRDIEFHNYTNTSTKAFGLTGSITNKTTVLQHANVLVTYYTQSGNVVSQNSKNIPLFSNLTVTYTHMLQPTMVNTGYTPSDIAKYTVEITLTDASSTIANPITTPSHVAEYSSYNYVIDSYDIYMKVNRDNSFDITENISAYFNASKHGIYRDLPLSNTIIRLDGTTSSNSARVSNVSVNHPFTTESSFSNYRIKIGDPASYVNGKVDYQISYKYSIGRDPSYKYDELYYNLIGTKWESPIGNITFTIEMPKEFDPAKLGFSMGKPGSVENDYIIYQVKDNIITGEVNDIIMPGEAVTVRLELEEGYFDEMPNYDWLYIILFVLPLVALTYSILTWKKHGKDDRVVEVINFYPPNGMNSLDLAFNYKGSVSSTDITSLLVYLAGKGYIKINEISETTLLCSQFTIEKLREYDGTDPHERMFLEGLFNTKKQYKSAIYLGKMPEAFQAANNNPNIVTSLDLQNKFYRTINKIERHIDKKANRNKIFYSTSTSKSWIIILLMIIIYLAMLSIPTFMCASLGEVGITILIALFYTPFFIVALGPEMPKIFRIFVLGFITIHFFGMTMALPYPSIIANNPIFIASTIVSLACLVGMGICCVYMPKRTPYGNEIYGHIKGFKRYLETAEKQQLEAMVYENPNYFYDILPYTYVLGISKKWISKFESIAIPEPDWYSGVSTFNITRFNRSLTSAMTTSSSSPSSSSSGGGGSSGGGSSGGGSGGGGGGSW